jgi:hypothetical protein
MSKKEAKIHTGFRLTKKNIQLLDSMSEKLGLNKTNVVDMILTSVGNDENLLINLIQKSLK